MTNVEAIEMLIRECPKSPRKSYGAMKKAAFLMAIDALSDKRKRDIENAVIDRVMAIIEGYDLYKSDEEGDLVCCRSEILGEIEFLKGGEG